MYPPVGFEVGALGVNFFAAFVVAHVDPSPLDVWRIWIDGFQVHNRPETPKEEKDDSVEKRFFFSHHVQENLTPI